MTMISETQLNFNHKVRLIVSSNSGESGDALERAERFLDKVSGIDFTVSVG